jgi:hypothetical protein
MIIALIFTGQSSAQIGRNDIVGIWLFDEGTGQTVKDSSSNGHHGKILGNVKWEKGRLDQALSFFGEKDNYVSIPYDKSFDLITWTVTAWVQMEKTGNWQAIVGKEEPATVRNYTIWVRGGTDVFDAHFSSGGPNQWRLTDGGKTMIADSKWHHVAGTYDKKALRMYVDGVLETEQAFSDTPDKMAGPLRIGLDSNNLYPAKGIIDEVGVFNVSLSLNGIEKIMTSGLKSTTAVFPSSKLTTTWGSIKNQ